MSKEIKKEETYTCYIKEKDEIKKHKIVLIDPSSPERIEVEYFPSDINAKYMMIAKFIGTNKGFFVERPHGTNGIDRAILRTIDGWVVFLDKDKNETSWIPKDRFGKYLK